MQSHLSILGLCCLCFGCHIQDIISEYNDMLDCVRWRTVWCLTEASQPQIEAGICWRLNPCSPFLALHNPAGVQKLDKPRLCQEETTGPPSWAARRLLRHLWQLSLLAETRFPRHSGLAFIGLDVPQSEPQWFHQGFQGSNLSDSACASQQLTQFANVGLIVKAAYLWQKTQKIQKSVKKTNHSRSFIIQRIRLRANTLVKVLQMFPSWKLYT